MKLGTLLHYVDDLLIARNTYEGCFLNTIKVLNHLAKRGHEVSPHKAHIFKQEVTYLGFQLEQGTGSVMADQTPTIATIKNPREPEASSWILMDDRVLPNLD